MACGSSFIKLVQNELQALHLFHEAGKAGLVEDSHIGKNLTVQSDVSLLQAVHEHAVGHAVGASAGIDTSDPQATENALPDRPSSPLAWQRGKHYCDEE